MTLIELNEHFELRIKYQKAKALVTELELKALPGSPVISDMPKMIGVGNKVEAIAVELIDLRSRMKYYEQEVKADEPRIAKFIDGIIDDQTRIIFRLRFLHGYTWEDVARAIGGRNSEQGVKMTCYRYLNKDYSSTRKKRV